MTMQFVKTFDEVLRIIHEHEVSDVQKYVVARTEKAFKERNKVTKDMRMHYEGDIPYFHLGKRCYVCHHGKDLNIRKKEKYAESRVRKAIEENVVVKRFQRLQPSKKLNCSATINVIKVMRFPDYKIPVSANWSAKRKISQLIKHKIIVEQLTGEEGYMFKLPTIEDHQNHSIEKSADIVIPVDEKIKDFVYNLVKEGKRIKSEIAELVEQYARNELMIQDKTNRQFYPSERILRKIINEARETHKQSKIDQENVINIINALDATQCRLVFRPCIEQDSNSENVQSSQDLQLLFVYQSNTMKELYRRYGNNMILLEAAYKVLKFALPLYFVLVQTNCDFQIVCVIIIQFASAESLTEALMIFRDWNPDINPRYGFVDNYLQEISSLEITFDNNTEVFISPFHREKAWSVWLTQKRKCGVPKRLALQKLESVANAISLNDLLVAINDLKSWKNYSWSPLQNYFETVWEPELRRWALLYNPSDMLLNTNNTIDKLHEDLNYSYFENFKNLTLSHMVDILINNFIPERYQNYLKENLLMLQQPDESLPKFLHHRPKWLITHIQKKISEISSAEVEAVTVIEKGKFRVLSEHDTFTVTFNEQNRLCSCICQDFLFQKLICKHVLMVGFKYPAWTVEQQSWILENAVFNVDECALTVCQEQLPSDDMDSNKECQVVMEVNDLDDSLNCFQNISGCDNQKSILINDCNSTIKSLQSLMASMNESTLLQLSESLKSNLATFSSDVQFVKIEVEGIEEPTSILLV